MTAKSKIKAKEKVQVKAKPESKVEDTEVMKTESLLPNLRHEIENTITLPEDVDTDKLEAEVSDGVLRVFMPKCEKKQKSRKIEVKKS